MTRSISRCAALAIVVGVIAAAPVAAQHTVVLVRHAERADASASPPSMAADPDLSAAGRERAASLATVLKNAKITAIFATELKRTQQTAAPLAKALGLTVTIVEADHMAELIKRVKSTKGNVLVVGHSNTVPDVIKGLGIASPPSIGDNDFDNLFLVTAGAKPSLLQLHYR
jgi:broad specificity phosphatase PhoE